MSLGSLRSSWLLACVLRMGHDARVVREIPPRLGTPFVLGVPVAIAGHRGGLMGACVFSVLGALLLGCQPEAPSARFETLLRVESDPGVPLAGAEVVHGGRSLGKTGSDGEVLVVLSGQPGDSVELLVRCPKGYREPPGPVTVSLRPLLPGSPTPRYQQRCPPLLRSVVVAIRAENGHNVPVLYRGREVARTDAQGAAHVALKVPPEETVSLTLDTSGPAHADLLGGSPELQFTMPAQDEIAVLEYAFERKPKKRKPRRKADPRPIDLSKR